MNRLLIALPCALLAACGDESPSAPSSTTTASAATTAVTVTVPNPVRMGQTAQAGGTETLSDGQTRSITSGWLSDAPAVATVTNAGLVSGIANGRATIYVVAGGRQGQQVVRVVPDYQGRWSGGLRVMSCSQTGVLASLDFCAESPVGSTYRYMLNLSQTGEQMVATVDYGAPWVFPGIAAPIREDGTSAFTPTTSVTDSGVTVSVDAAFTINSIRTGELTGTVTEVWRVPNFSGEGRLTQDIVATTRDGTATLSSVGEGNARRLRVMRKLTLNKQ
jgi:hypothetical protein